MLNSDDTPFQTSTKTTNHAWSQLWPDASSQSQVTQLSFLPLDSLVRLSYMRTIVSFRVKSRTAVRACIRPGTCVNVEVVFVHPPVKESLWAEMTLERPLRVGCVLLKHVDLVGPGLFGGETTLVTLVALLVLPLDVGLQVSFAPVSATTLGAVQQFSAMKHHHVVVHSAGALQLFPANLTDAEKIFQLLVDFLTFMFFALVVLDQDDVGEGLSALAAAVHHDSAVDGVNMLLVLGHVGNLEVVARPTSLVVGAHLLQVHAILVLAIEDFTTGGATVLSFWVLA